MIQTIVFDVSCFSFFAPQLDYGDKPFPPLWKCSPSLFFKHRSILAEHEKICESIQFKIPNK